MSISTNFTESQSLNGDCGVITGVNREPYQYVKLESQVDIKYELPRQSEQLLDYHNQEDEEDNEVDSESWLDGGASGGGASAVDCQISTLTYGGIGGQPVSELKDPLEINSLESKPEVKTILTGTSITTAVSSSTPIHQTKPKQKTIKTAICTKCNTSFASPFLFEQHMIQVHQDDRPYPCKVCEKPFAKRAKLKRHEAIHNPNRFKGEPQFPCDICGKRYHIKVSMEGHKKKNHLGYKPPKKHYSGPVKQHHSTSGVKNPNPYRKPKEIHQCPHCDLTFKMKCLLKKHMICHTKERPFPCPICQQPFAKKTNVKSHIRTVHHSATTPSGMRHPRPKWQSRQPCPCSTCGKTFATPSQLANHVLLHTGEKPHGCSECGKKFRLKHDLNSHIKRNHLKDKLFTNPLKLYKCRICGKDDFLHFMDLNNHRQTYHRHISFDSETEKPFGCGICGKPYYLREGAVICALLGHDPTSLRKAMFKHKCSECPPENFGYHNLTFLRRHWEVEHGDKKLPVQFRVGMYSNNLKVDALPTCVIDKVKKNDIKLNGPPREEVESEVALYTEFDLLPIPEEERFFRKGVV